MNDFSTKLISWRTTHKCTQEGLAEICNTSVRSIQSWESGNRYPGFHSLIALADAMDVSIDWLCGRDSSSDSVNFITYNIV